MSSSDSVSSSSHDTTTTGLSASKLLAAGALSRCSAALILYPFDLVKTRLQYQSPHLTSPSPPSSSHQGMSSLSPSLASSTRLSPPVMRPYRGVLDCVCRIFREEGIFAFYRGLSLRLIYVAPAAAVSFYLYEEIKHLLLVDELGSDPAERSPPWVPLAAGAAANLFGTATRTPFDIVKQQMQTRAAGTRARLSLRSQVIHVVEHYGIRGLFRGYGIACLRDAPFAGLYFSIYEMTKRRLSEFTAHPSPTGHVDVRWQTTTTLHHLVAGALAGCIATCTTIPIDVVKTRVQLNSFYRNEVSALVAARELFAEDGWRGFTRGLHARLMVVVPSASFTFAFYERYKQILRRF